MQEAALRRICDFYHSLCTAHKVNIIRSTRTATAGAGKRELGGREGELESWQLRYYVVEATL